jgi:hypothetical protein
LSIVESIAVFCFVISSRTAVVSFRRHVDVLRPATGFPLVQQNVVCDANGILGLVPGARLLKALRPRHRIVGESTEREKNKIKNIFECSQRYRKSSLGGEKISIKTTSSRASSRRASIPEVEARRRD